MALAGTNHSCRICIHEHRKYHDYLTRSFKSINKFRQPILPSFPCPSLLPYGKNCSGSDSIFGKGGECLGCVLYRDYIFKLHVLRNPPLSRYHNVTYIGYERSVIATLEDSSYELLDSLRDSTYSSTCNFY